MEKNYSDSINILQTQWYQADLNQRFTINDQEVWGLDLPRCCDISKEDMEFQHHEPHKRGYKRPAKADTKKLCGDSYSKWEQKTADQLTKCLYHNHKEGFHTTFSDAFQLGAIIQGLGFMYMYGIRQKILSAQTQNGDMLT